MAGSDTYPAANVENVRQRSDASAIDQLPGGFLSAEVFGEPDLGREIEELICVYHV